MLSVDIYFVKVGELLNKYSYIYFIETNYGNCKVSLKSRLILDREGLKI